MSLPSALLLVSLLSITKVSESSVKNNFQRVSDAVVTCLMCVLLCHAVQCHKVRGLHFRGWVNGSIQWVMV